MYVRKGVTMKNLYCIPKLNSIEKYLAFSKEYNAGFEYNDFFLPDVLDDTTKVEQLVQAYISLDRDRSEDTLHGVFLDICVHSADSMIFKASDYRIHQCMDIAMTLGVRAVIFHTNYISNFTLKSYQDNWVELNTNYWKNLLNEYPNLMIYIENMFDEEPFLLKELAEKMADEKRFAVCYDIAHAFLSYTPLESWCEELSPYVRHMHINDNDKQSDLHKAVGSGQLPWKLYDEFISSFPSDQKPSILIEVGNFDTLVSSINYMKNHQLYPFK